MPLELHIQTDLNVVCMEVRFNPYGDRFSEFSFSTTLPVAPGARYEWLGSICGGDLKVFS